MKESEYLIIIYGKTSMLYPLQNFLLYQTIVTENWEFSKCIYVFFYINIEKKMFYQKRADDFHISKVKLLMHERNQFIVFHSIFYIST